MNLAGLHAGFDAGQFSAVNPALAPIRALWESVCGEDIACPNDPRDQGGGAIVVGEARILRKNDIDLYGISFAKEIAGISVGLDLVYRDNMALSVGVGPGLFNIFNLPDLTSVGLPDEEGLADILGIPYIPGDYYSYDSNNYRGPTGQVASVIINGLGLLNGDLGIWDGGVWIAEATFITATGIDKKDKHLLDVDIHKNRINSHVGGIFKPTWYQVFPGWDMSIPMSVSYTIDGDQAPIAFTGQKTGGNASVGVSFLVNQVWTLDAKFNSYFGGINRGLGALNKDRDNISMTVKRTW